MEMQMIEQENQSGGLGVVGSNPAAPTNETNSLEWIAKQRNRLGNRLTMQAMSVARFYRNIGAPFPGRCPVAVIGPDVPMHAEHVLADLVAANLIHAAADRGGAGAQIGAGRAVGRQSFRVTHIKR
jgi:hypothetical protein